MVETIIQYTGEYLKDKITFLDVVNAPVKRLTNGVIYKNEDSQKTNVSISDDVGYAVYIRQTAPESVAELPLKTSMGNEYKISSRCRLVFYSFKNDHSEEKVKSILISNLGGVRFPRYIGTSYSFKIIINNISTDFEKIYLEERGGNYTGDNWPTIIAIDFTITYEDKNCNVCDLTPELNCFELPPSQEFPSSSGEPGKTFCDRVAACSAIIALQETVVSLQEQIDQGGGGDLTCDNLPECQTIIDILASISGIISSLPSSYFTCASLAGCQTIIDIMAAIDELEAGLASTDENLTLLSQDFANLIGLVNTLQSDLNNHVGDTNNPHQTTLEQVRAENNVINGNIDFDGNQADNVANPSSNQQISTKLYTDTAEANAKSYADSLVVAVFRPAGDWDASVGTYPTTGTGSLGAIRRGDTYKISVAGNMGGYAYDVGDSIYAIVAVPGQLAANWGDFEHNTQQATESERGTGQIVTAAIIADENSLDDAKIVTTKKLWLNFWQRVLALAWTWAAKQTFTTAPRFSSANVSQYLKTDGSKDLTSVGAIPATDITEDITHRFATDAEKTLWNAKMSSINYYNVKDYGAIGNGVADDTTAINNAISASITATGNANLIFPQGNYLVNTQILISNSSANINILGYNSNLISGISVVGNSVFRVSAANSVSIKDLNIDFNLNAVAHYGFRLGDNAGGGFVSLAKIEGCSFFDFGANQRGILAENIRYSSGPSGNFNMPSLIVDNCNFFNYLTGAGAIDYNSNSLFGIGIQLGEVCEYSRIINCSFNFIAIGINSVSGGNTDITGCNFLGCLPKQSAAYTYGAIYIPNSGSNNGKHNIVGCKFNHMYGYCIYVSYATAERPVTIKSCQFIANGTTAIYITHTATVAARHQINDNYFERCSQAFTNGFTNQPFGASLQPFIYLNNQLRCVIRLNTFLNDGTYGVVSANSANFNIVKNNNWFNITGISSLVGANNQVGDNDNL